MNDHEFYETDQCDDVEALNRRRIAGWWDLLGEEPAYPASTDQTIHLLRAVEYDASHDVILDLVNNQRIPPVPRQAGRLAWTATAIVTAAAALEARRMWIPFGLIHAHKWTQVEKVKQILDHRGQEAFCDLSAFDLPHLLGMLIDVSHDPGAVQGMAEAIREKLKLEGVL